ncbi:glycosyltransferase family 1 protein [Kineococcus sp. NUM-3379]
MSAQQPGSDARSRTGSDARSRTEPLVLVLGTADWDAVIGTNQHYVTRALAQRFGVVFTEGTGTRRLRLSDARRVLRRLRPSAPTGARRPVPDGVQVVTPRLVPSHGRPVRPLNSRLLHAQVRRWVEHPGPRLLWTYTPYAYGLAELADATVYHLVDLLHENPGVDRASLLAAERELARRADVAIGTSAPIQEHLRSQGFRSTLCLRNVADVAVFARAAERRTGPRLPVVVFAGAVTEHKLDLELLAALARGLRGTARLRLIGPVSPGATAHPRWRELLDAGAEVVAPVPLEELAEEYASAAVGIVPYRSTPLTQGITPLKTFEYLAAGLPVVSTPLPGVEPVREAVWVEDGAEAFVARVRTLAAAWDRRRSERCRSLASGHDWSARGEELRSLLASLVAA